MIRNFSIIAHIDHGKSTLADRMLELTGTVEKRKMRAQVLDKMDLERERGITIKMTPVRMDWKGTALNLIDTPGHVDFSYEVSRAQKAVEGAVLLVDATQGVQAQTLSVLEMARQAGLVILPVVNKIDLPIARVQETKDEIVQLLHCSASNVLEVSGKTGAGVAELLDAIVARVPPPASSADGPASSADGPALPVSRTFPRALIFDFEYSTHRGIILYVRVFEGSVRTGDDVKLLALNQTFSVQEVGTFLPEGYKRADLLSAGEIGYVVTGIKNVVRASVGDTLTSASRPLAALAGYERPKPVVWASVYPESQDEFPVLKQALGRLRLQDASLSFEEETSGSLGRGFRCGFLGMLHLEIIIERLTREFHLALIVTSPTISYEVQVKGARTTVTAPALFPDEGMYEEAWEPWLACTLITPPDYLSRLIPLLHEHEAVLGETELFGDRRNALHFEIPLRELMRHFFEEVKSASSGYASLSYAPIGMRPARVLRLDVLLAGERVTAFSRVISSARVEREAEDLVEKLKAFLPRQLFEVKIQAAARGRILASRTLSALRKDVTGYLYGGDITRKMKLLEKQKRGKKRMRAHGKVQIPHDVFLKMMAQ